MKSVRLSQILAAALLGAGVAGLVTAVASGPVTPSLGTVSGGGSELTLGLYVDLLSAVLVTFIASIALLVATYSHRNLRGQDRLTRFGILLAASTLSLALMVTAASLPLIAAGWTVSGLTLAALVAHRTEPEAARAARSVRRRLLIGDLLLWSGVLAAWLTLPDLDRADLAASVTPGFTAVVVAGLLAAAATVRSALVPAWDWLPQTAHAPSPVSAYLHAGIVNGAGVLVALTWPLFFAAPQVLAAILIVGTLTAVIATVAAKVRPDVKGQLAASTSAQMGYMSIQLGLGLPAAAVFHLIGHGYFKAWLFLRAGGAVSRRRTTHVPASISVTRGVIGLAVGVAAVGATVAAVWPLISGTVTALGPAALVPVMAAAATAAVGLSSLLVRSQTRTVAASAAVAAATLGLLAFYLILLSTWDGAVASALPEVPVWSAPMAWAWLGVLLIAAAVTVLGVREVARRPDGRVSVAALRTALPVRAIATPHRTHVAAGACRSDRARGDEIAELVGHAAALVGPAYPLRSMVAANPLAGMEGLPFIDAARITHQVRGGKAFLPESQYLELMVQGKISRRDLAAVLSGDYDLGRPVEAVIDEILLEARAQPGAPDHKPVLTLAERRAPTSSAWSPAEVARLHDAVWSARVWGDTAVPAADGDLYRRWQTAAEHGWGAGLGVPALAASLPETPAHALAELLTRSGVPESEWFEYLCRLLVVAPGWAGHAVWRADSGHAGAVVELLAVRAAHDLAVGGPTDGPTPVAHPPAHPVVALADPLARQRLWQEGLEEHYRSSLLTDLKASALAMTARDDRGPVPLAQLIMCIDVRSERLRRHLEATGDIRTFGFAGFFGAAVRVVNDFGQTSDQCPALLKPTHEIHTGPGSADTTGQVARRTARDVWGTPTTAFALAESTGVVAGMAAAVQTFAPALTRARYRSQALVVARPTAGSDPTDGLPLGFTTGELANLAYSALHGIGLEGGFAPVLVVVGHGATVTNNAFAAAYECGACGGNAGIENARILAHALNHADVRSELARRGIVVPDTTVAVAAFHDTTTDEVHLDQDGGTPELDALGVTVATAGAAVAAERLGHLPGAPMDPAQAVRHVRRRAGDWAQPCPEWGLAGNAAFVIGPRDLTRDLDLDGRVFLHSYDPDVDHDHTVLQTILTAPVIVAQWINAQYYMSSVDPERFGAGDKSTHNVIGDVGVVTGAHGDLRTGLPWQALFAAEAQLGTGLGAHVPLRLTVVAYAVHEAIRRVVAGSEALSRLVTNEWICLTAIDPGSATVRRLRPDLEWVSPDLAVMPDAMANSADRPAGRTSQETINV